MNFVICNKGIHIITSMTDGYFWRRLLIMEQAFKYKENGTELEIDWSKFRETCFNASMVSYPERITSICGIDRGYSNDSYPDLYVADI